MNLNDSNIALTVVLAALFSLLGIWMMWKKGRIWVRMFYPGKSLLLLAGAFFTALILIPVYLLVENDGWLIKNTQVMSLVKLININYILFAVSAFYGSLAGISIGFLIEAVYTLPVMRNLK